MGERLTAARVSAPGRIIRRELDARGWTQKDLAHIMDRPEQTISQIVNAKKRITPETALQLAAAFGTSAELWLKLEASYQLHQARDDDDNSEIRRRSRLYSLVPLTEICKRGWIRSWESFEKLEQEVCDFLDIATLDDEPRLAVSFRQSDIGDPEVAAEMAWVKRVEHLARRQTVGDFDRGRLEAALPELVSYAAAVQDVRRVPSFLRDQGVHFVIVPHLAKTYLDGAAFWLNGNPVVAMTLRYDRIDNFWFTLLHELAHIVAGHEGGYLDDLDEEADTPEEIEANGLARDWLLDPEALCAFVDDVESYFSEKRIRTFARTQGLHPGIVLGRLQHERLVPCKNLRKLLVPVEGCLTAWVDRVGP